MRKSILLAVCATISATAWAETLQPAQALERALQSTTMSKAPAAKPAAYALAYTQSTPDGVPACYVFTLAHAPQGFIVVGADDLAAPLLGYSDESQFDIDNMPDGLKYWLGAYGRQIQAARAAQDDDDAPQTTPNSLAFIDYDPVETLMQTKWDQDGAYSGLCPIYNQHRCVTGCVATAMAQAIKWYAFPEYGRGQFSYYCSGISQTVSFDYEKTRFKYNLMLNTYGASSMLNQRQAVAQLMRGCGVAVEMQYTPNESGAYAFDVARQLVDIFRYRADLEYQERDYFSLGDWQAMVIDELVNYGPLIYVGYGSGGHCFNMDGYAQDGFFHLNWGWGGVSDGYYRIDGLNPSIQGIGGSGYHFNDGQAFMYKMKPTTEDEEQANPYLQMCMDYPLEVQLLPGMISWTNYALNYSNVDIAGVTGMKLTTSDGQQTIYCMGQGFSTPHFKASSGELYEAYGTNIALPNDLADDYYLAQPVWQDSVGAWHDVRVKYADRCAVVLRADGGNVSVVPEVYKAPVCEQFAAELTADSTITVTATMTNNSANAWQCFVQPVLTNAYGATIWRGRPALLSIEPGESADWEYADAYDCSYDGQARIRLVSCCKQSLDVTPACEIALQPSEPGASPSIMAADSESVATEHYNLQGIRLSAPNPAGVTITVTHHPDGTTTSRLQY